MEFLVTLSVAGHLLSKLLFFFLIKLKKGDAQSVNGSEQMWAENSSPQVECVVGSSLKVGEFIFVHEPRFSRQKWA